jgi:hypothetical protein
MSFLDWLTGKIECPRCGTSGAKEIKGRIHCPNPTCEYFSTTQDKGGAAPGPITFSSPAEVPAGCVAIQYRNFRGQGKTFVAQAASARRRNNHISVIVEPKRARIALARDRIMNLNEVEAALPQRAAAGQEEPTPRERQVMTYHKIRGSTSPLYESLRAKYPNW